MTKAATVKSPTAWHVGTKLCAHCHAIHEYKYADSRTRQSGRQNCLACGKGLIRWHGVRVYTAFKLLVSEEA
jgi:hypothetical protein